MTILNFEGFMKKYNSKKDTMNESQLQKKYNCPVYPRNSKIHSDKRFVNINDGRMGGSHWTCFYRKDNNSNYFDSFGGQTDKFFLKQVPKSIIYHNYKIQVIKSK